MVKAQENRKERGKGKQSRGKDREKCGEMGEWRGKWEGSLSFGLRLWWLPGFHCCDLLLLHVITATCDFVQRGDVWHVRIGLLTDWISGRTLAKHKATNGTS